MTRRRDIFTAKSAPKKVAILPDGDIKEAWTGDVLNNPSLTDAAMVVAVMMAVLYLSRETRFCWPPETVMVGALGVDRTSLRHALAELAAFGLIVRDPAGGRFSGAGLALSEARQRLIEEALPRDRRGGRSK